MSDQAEHGSIGNTYAIQDKHRTSYLNTYAIIPRQAGCTCRRFGTMKEWIWTTKPCGIA